MTHPPVLVVHGYLATRTLMLPMKRRLERIGRRTHLADLTPLCLGGVDALTRQLAVSVERVLRVERTDRLDVVGVSQGGLLALRYAQRMNGHRSVRRLVAVGAPFRGSWAALAGVVAFPPLGLVSRGIWEMMPTSRIVREGLDTPLPAGLDVTSIAMDGDLVAPPAACHLPGARNVVLSGLPSPVTHQWLVASDSAFREIADALDR